MERLTSKYWRNLDPWEMCGQDNYCKRGCHEQGGCTKGCIVPRIYARLAAYEDTGLEPEEIYEVRFLIAAQRDPQKLARLRELVLADQDGRLVVLPCKVGDRVWVTRAYGKPFDAPREGHVRKFVVHDDELVFLEALIWMDLGEGKNEYGYRTESFGKIVHLTREEAEEALALKGGEGNA